MLPLSRTCSKWGPSRTCTSMISSDRSLAAIAASPAHACAAHHSVEATWLQAMRVGMPLIVLCGSCSLRGTTMHDAVPAVEVPPQPDQCAGTVGRAPLCYRECPLGLRAHIQEAHGCACCCCRAFLMQTCSSIAVCPIWVAGDRQAARSCMPGPGGGSDAPG